MIVRRTPDGKIEDVLPPPFSARTLVNEYGGGALLASQASCTSRTTPTSESGG